jgi:hypothetical protein
VTQFSVFTANRMGRLHDLIALLSSHAVHVLAVTVLDTTETAIIRLVVDDPQRRGACSRKAALPSPKANCWWWKSTPPRNCRIDGRVSRGGSQCAIICTASSRIRKGSPFWA